jgi:hypothetical protein
MAKRNPICGEERIAAELLLKLRIRVSPRTVRRYMPTGYRPGPRSVQKLDLIDSLQGVTSLASDILQACAQLWIHFNLSLLPLLDG